MNPAEFVAKWTRVNLPERAASQEHFIDLCRLIGQPTPAEHDATGAEYAFEKGVDVSSGASKGSKGDRGFADVWWKGKFGLEYKRKDKYKTLDEAYRQLQVYREALESPPLLIVSDIARIEIHTNFTGTPKVVHTILLEEMAEPRALDLLRRVFTNPESFRPTITAEKITQDVAAQLGAIAEGLRKRGCDPHDTAHFLMKCMFCFFAEDVNLLPEKLFKNLLEKFHRRPADLTKRMNELFAAMRSGGAYGNDDIAYFNGGLFDDKPALQLTEGEVGLLNMAAAQDWGSVEPAVFGTLFERSLDPAKRSQIGAHYTSREDILLVVEPVIMDPLRREWEQVREKVLGLVEKRTPLIRRKAKERDSSLTKQITTLTKSIEKAVDEFVTRLAGLVVLDPACGSGNFLYVAIQRLLDLEKEVITFAARTEIGLGLLPRVRPTQLRGIEINPYAAELAQVVIWIGYLQWMRDNGFNPPRNPILANLSTIENRDAILQWSVVAPISERGGEATVDAKSHAKANAKSGPARRSGPPQGISEPLPKAAEWPEADYIIGNPPFLGSKLFRKNGLEDHYVQMIFGAYDLPRASDLCCYWFEQARAAVDRRRATRVGLLATQGIRGDDNRAVLERLSKVGGIFMAWSDRDWVLDGAAVHVSIVGFGDGRDVARVLDGVEVSRINPDLTSGDDIASAKSLAQNAAIYVRSPEKGAPFEVDWLTARRLLASPNANGKSTSDVLRPWINGEDLVGGRPSWWIVDFSECTNEAEAAGYDAAYDHIEKTVKPARQTNRDPKLRERWWLYRRSGEGVRNAAREQRRLLGTSMVSKHRIFAWMPSEVQPDKTIPAFARDDEYFFGVVQTSIHVLWALRHGTQLEDRPRYTPTTCFETFPLPWAPGKEPVKHASYLAIAEAAKELDAQRERWLNPPEWIGPIAARIDAADNFADVPEAARALIRQSAIMSAAAADPKLKKRTLTNLYNERPTWLRLAHEKLDRAVLSAYAAVDPKGGWDEEWATVWVESGAGQPLPKGHALTTRRAEVEEKVLGNLLRLNKARAKKS